jgi:tRNA(Arg) A34 adenosine deaminase TadA
LEFVDSLVEREISIMEATTLTQEPSVIVSTLLSLAETQVIPKLRESVATGNFPFAAAILTQEDLKPVTVSTNHFKDSPLLHGETSCIREFFLNPKDSRPEARSSVFFSTHEPCSLCLSGIAWTGFPVVYHLFTYQNTHDLLGVSMDPDIIKEVFRVRAPSDTDETLRARPLYNKQNRYFSIMSISELIDKLQDEDERNRLKKEAERVKSLWAPLNHIFTNGSGE